MITAILKKQDGLYRGFEISGHADSAPHGQDLVCAAVSLLTIAVENSLEQQVGRVLMASADGLVQCRLPEGLDELAMVKAQAIMETLNLGLKCVREQYPQYIRLQIVNVRH